MADGSVKIDIEADDSKFQETIDGLGDDVRDATDGMGDLGDSGGKVAGGLGTADIAAAQFVSNGLNMLIGAVGDALGALMGLADETREYREDMAKLETAFTTAGHGTDTATKAYQDFYAILGESDRSVEAVNHLAELTKSEEEVAKWSTIAAGVTAKFGDSLPIEGLTEAANETAKVGKVTGPLADALNWAGISEDEFNTKLEACNSEQERATLITETLNKQYQSAADEYNSLTESTQDARRATAEMEETQARLGAAMEPVITAWTNLKAQALEAIAPVIEKVVEKLLEVQAWMEENPEKAEVLKGVIVGIAAALGVLVAVAATMSIINIVTKAFAALNLVMLANPTTLIIAGIAALVAAFIYLWNNCDAFREFWIGLWDKIKEIAGAVADWFKQAWSDTLTFVKNLWSGITGFFSDLWNGVKTGVSNFLSAVGKFFSDAWEAIKKIWSNSIVGNYFSTVWEVIKAVFSVVKNVFTGNFSDAWEGIKKIVGLWAGYFSNIWGNIKGAFANVGSWFGEKFTEARDKVINAFSNIGEKFAEIKKGIIDVFADIKDLFHGIGSNIITGIWNGLSDGWDWLTGNVSSLATSLYKTAKAALDINSPSKKFAYLGNMSAAGMDKGFSEQIPKVERDMMGDISGLTGRLKSAVSAESTKAGQTLGSRDTGYYDLARAVGTQTAGINSLASEYRRGTGSMKPVVLELNGRELGRTVVDVGGAEETRVGVKLAVMGA